jgi:hypothetical protein
MQDGDSAYRTRAAAARLAVDPTASSGTELGLLQRGAINQNESRKPFYLEARRVTGLYREALAVSPSDDQMRLDALRAALLASQDSLAIALAPLLYRPEGFLAASGLDAQAKAEVARDVALAYERQGDLARAIEYTKVAIALGQNLESKEKQLEAEQSRNAENARRAPRIWDNIEQDHVVQPRLSKGPS